MVDEAQVSAPQTETENLDQAAQRLERLLSDGSEKRKTRSRDVEGLRAEAEAPEAEEAAEDQSELEDEVEADRPETSDEGEDDAATEEEPEGEEGGDQKFPVKVNGKVLEVTLDELKNGYSRTSDYHAKTQALAEERKGFQAERAQVQAEREQYAQLLPALAAQLQAALPQPPDKALRETDPARYFIEKDEYESSLAKLNAAAQEYERVNAANQAEQLKALQQQVADAAKRLPDLIPAWKDAKVFERDRVALRAFLQKSGYSEDEINAAYDPRAIVNAWKAMRYDELTSKKLKADAPIQKAVRPAAAPAEKPARYREDREVRERLKQTGRVEDAAMLIRNLL